MIDIVLTTDANYVMPCGILLLSICKSNPDTKISVHIICDDSVTQKEKSELGQTISPYQFVTLNYYTIDGNLFDNYPSLQNAYLSKAAYYRLFLTDILPNTLDKVLYLDCDMLVMKSLTELWNTDISRIALAAVIDSMECYHVDWYNRLRYNPSKLYFNSGVMLINLDYWRKHLALDKFMDYLSNYRDRIVSHDQDILNVIFQDAKILLPIEYNLQEGFLFRKRCFYFWDYANCFEETLLKPTILHYTVNKPWQKTCKHPLKNKFIELCNETIWKGFKLQDYPIKKTNKQKAKMVVIQLLRFFRLKKKAEPMYIDMPTVGGVKI